MKSIEVLINEFNCREAVIKVAHGIRMVAPMTLPDEAYKRLGQSLARIAANRGYQVPTREQIEVHMESYDCGHKLGVAARALIEKDPHASALLYVVAAYEKVFEEQHSEIINLQAFAKALARCRKIKTVKRKVARRIA